ncbi:MAG: hypothetical protein JXA81_04355 [Sedimentisphaerales bacterium]|nr:hypothetical protein [Sedimentisphaerales bacterium]
MKIDVFCDVAIVYYSYETKWAMEGKTFSETGNDVMVLGRTEGKWLLIWRTLIPLAQDS